MSLKLKAYGVPEQRGSIENPNVPISEAIDFLLDGEESLTGRRVSANSALKYHAVWRAVDLIAKDIAKVNVFIYERGAGGNKERARDHAAYKLIRKRPNSWQTHYTFFHMLTAHATLHGNGYAFISRDIRGRPLELIPLDPGQVTVLREGGEVVYWIRDVNIKVTPADVIHIKRFTWDGLVGLNPINYARENFGLGLAGTDYQNVFFNNNGKPSAVLETPNVFTPEAAARLRRSWNSAHTGVTNAHKVAILENGLQLKPYSINPKDAQVLELLQDNVRAIANIFNLPPHKLGDTTRTSFASLEQENQAYLDDTLDPMLVNWEQELAYKLLTEDEHMNDTHFVEFDRKALMRADLAATGEFLTKALQSAPWMTINEARTMLNMNTLEGYDEILIPTNNFGEPVEDAPPEGGPPTDDVADTGEDEETARAVYQMLDNTARRYWRRLSGRATREAKKKAPDYTSWVDEVRAEFCDDVAPLSVVLSCRAGEHPNYTEGWSSILFDQFNSIIQETKRNTPATLDKRLKDNETAAIAALKGGIE